MGVRLIKAAETIITAVVRLCRWWFRQIGRQDTLRGKAIVACVGLLALCVVCSVPVTLINGPSQPRTAVAVAPTAKPTLAEIEAPTSAPTTAPSSTPVPSPTSIPPTNTAIPSPTDEPPTATPEPTATPTDIPTATPEPTAKPQPIAKPAPKPLAVPATNRLNTNGADRYNCGDFANYAEAYAVYKANLPGDPNDLDRDNDGIPCESLPGAP